LPLEVAQVGTLHAVRAMQRGVSRQDAFLILKLATYSSGFAGSNGFPITENDLYDVAGGVIDFGNEARAGGSPTSQKISFRLPLGWCRSAFFKRLRSTSAAASGQTLRGSAAEDIALR
jgi:hypothetical protein